MTKDDGLYPNYVNPRSGRFCQRKFGCCKLSYFLLIAGHISVGALGDSFYEYLLKVWIAGGRRDAAIKSMYDNATAAIESHLLYQSKQQKLWYFAELKGIRVVRAAFNSRPRSKLYAQNFRSIKWIISLVLSLECMRCRRSSKVIQIKLCIR